MSEVASQQILLQGNDACVKGALLAGCRFYAGYPITPATEIMEVMARELPKVGGAFIQMEDEIASLGAVIGASLAGVKSMTATSGPGFSLMQEHIGFACMAEVPCVIVDVMRAGPSTGLPTQPSQGDVMQARWGTHGDHPIIVLTPSSVYEFFELTVRAFNLSERYRTPVILLVDELVAHLREGVVLPSAGEIEIEERSRPRVPPEWYIPYADRCLRSGMDIAIT
jgi:2-oxoglutarate ferredoxin oxidoreductase subunit alpha